jgi:2-oxo-3-hexenedioate decarboxylase/2-keto-4-pentenoate hydratase
MSGRGGGRAEGAARRLFETRRSGETLRRLPAELRPADVEAAYETQRVLQELLAGAGGCGPIGGWKIALTAKVIQELLGVDTPCAGAVFRNTIHASPATLPVASYGRVAVECEIAVRLGRDLDGGSGVDRHTRESVAEAVEALMPSIEIVDDGNANYAEFDAIELIADNAWNAGLVLGAPVADWRGLDLAALEGAMSIAGEAVGRGRGGDVLGHPFEALAWLANTLIAQGRPLRRGMVVSTGSIVRTHWPKPGDEVVISIEGIGEAVARFE